MRRMRRKYTNDLQLSKAKFPIRFDDKDEGDEVMLDYVLPDLQQRVKEILGDAYVEAEKEIAAATGAPDKKE